MLVHIDPRYLDAVWPHVEALLSEAIDRAHGETDISQLKMEIRQGITELFVWQEADVVITAGTVSFTNYPNYRVANVSYLGGRYTDESFQAMKSWLASLGASHLQCWCDDAAARLYTRYGMRHAYNVMRCEL